MKEKVTNIQNKIAELKKNQAEDEVDDAGPKSPEGEHALTEVESLQIMNLRLARENLDLKLEGLEQQMQTIGRRIRERLLVDTAKYDLAFSHEKPGIVVVRRKPKEETE